VAENTRLRLVKLAVKRYGRDELAKRLRITPEQLDGWIRGERDVPNTKMLAVIDLIDRLGALGEDA
jgi:DNA-binding transcriptional regulator YdaS (Cro superfamily)